MAGMASLVYVTGVPGAGKSSIRRELRRLGYPAFGTDEDGIAAFFDVEGCQVHQGDVVDSGEWRSAHSLRILPSRLDELAEAVGGRIFVCGSAANEADVWDRFAAVVALVVDESTVHRRLDQRVGNNFGKSADERSKVLSWLHGYAENFRSYGAIIIDATRPIDEVADAVLAATLGLESDESVAPPPG